MLALVGSEVWPVSNFIQQLPTSRNNTQNGVQTLATCWAQQCCERLHGVFRPTRSWFSHQLISIYTEVSLRLHQQYDRVTGNRKTEDTNLKFQKVARAWGTVKWEPQVKQKLKLSTYYVTKLLYLIRMCFDEPHYVFWSSRLNKGNTCFG